MTRIKKTIFRALAEDYDVEFEGRVFSLDLDVVGCQMILGIPIGFLESLTEPMRTYFSALLFHHVGNGH